MSVFKHVRVNGFAQAGVIEVMTDFRLPRPLAVHSHTYWPYVLLQQRPWPLRFLLPAPSLRHYSFRKHPFCV